MALHSSLVAAVLLQHRDTVPARGTGRGSSPGDSPIGEDMQRPPTSSKTVTLQPPPPSSLQVRNRAQEGLTHQCVSLTDYPGAIRLVPHQGGAAWDQLPVE